MDRLRGLGLAAAGVSRWPLPCGQDGALPSLQSLDLRSEYSDRAGGWGDGLEAVVFTDDSSPRLSSPSTSSAHPSSRAAQPSPNPPTPQHPTPCTADNPLGPIPPTALRPCPDLRLLDLSAAPSTTITALPPTIFAAATKLEVLLLSGCRVAALPWEALRRLAGSLKRLDLSGGALTELPGCIAEFKR